jgi:branched-chain amino acid transport system ATP-binding protein
LIRPTRGRVLLDGKDLLKSSVATISRCGVAFVPEGRGVFAGMSVWENIAAAAYAQGRDRRWVKGEIERYLHIFPILAERKTQRAGSLSGGEQQMLAVVRALINRPRVLLIDEPGLGLAPIIITQLYKELARLNADDGLSILLVEQYVDLALKTAHRAYVMEKGQIVAETKCGQDDYAVARDLVAGHVS